MPALTTKAVSGRYYHGVRDLSVYQRICRGQDVLRIAAEHASDPGDLGQGLYVTKSRDEAFKRGVFVRLLAGGNSLAVAPPFIITTEQIDTIVKVLDESIGIVERQLGY